MLKHISSPLDPLSLMSEKKLGSLKILCMENPAWFLGSCCSGSSFVLKTCFFTVRLSCKCFTFQLQILFYFSLLDVHQKLHAIVNGAKRAAIMFNSSRMHWQISICVTKATFCFPLLETETEGREETITIPGFYRKSVMVQVGKIWMAWLRHCLILTKHFNQNSCHL